MASPISVDGKTTLTADMIDSQSVDVELVKPKAVNIRRKVSTTRIVVSNEFTDASCGTCVDGSTKLLKRHGQHSPVFCYEKVCRRPSSLQPSDTCRPHCVIRNPFRRPRTRSAQVPNHSISVNGSACLMHRQVEDGKAQVVSGRTQVAACCIRSESMRLASFVGVKKEQAVAEKFLPRVIVADERITAGPAAADSIKSTWKSRKNSPPRCLSHRLNTPTKSIEHQPSVIQEPLPEKLVSCGARLRHMPIDWCLKSRLCFSSPRQLPWSGILKTSEEASGITGCVRALFNSEDVAGGNAAGLPSSCSQGLQQPQQSASAGTLPQTPNGPRQMHDSSPQARFYQSCLYWQHPSLPWLSLFPRQQRRVVPASGTSAFVSTGTSATQLSAATENSSNLSLCGAAQLHAPFREALAQDFRQSFKSVYLLLRARQCPYFYVCASDYTVLFRAAGVAAIDDIHALIAPTTKGFRKALRANGVDFRMPLLQHKSNEKSEPGGSGDTDCIKIEKEGIQKRQQIADPFQNLLDCNFIQKNSKRKVPSVQVSDYDVPGFKKDGNLSSYAVSEMKEMGFAGSVSNKNYSVKKIISKHSAGKKHIENGSTLASTDQNKHISGTFIEDDENENEDECDDEGFFQSLGVGSEGLPTTATYASARKRRNALSRSVFSDEPGIESCVAVMADGAQALFNYLLNTDFNSSNVSSIRGSSAMSGIPPTLLAPVAFHGASLRSLKVRQKWCQVAPRISDEGSAGGLNQREKFPTMSEHCREFPISKFNSSLRTGGAVPVGGQHHLYHTVEIVGPIMPHAVDALCSLLATTQKCFTLHATPLYGSIAFSQFSAYNRGHTSTPDKVSADNDDDVEGIYCDSVAPVIASRSEELVGSQREGLFNEKNEHLVLSYQDHSITERPFFRDITNEASCVSVNTPVVATQDGRDSDLASRGFPLPRDFTATAAANTSTLGANSQQPDVDDRSASHYSHRSAVATTASAGGPSEGDCCRWRSSAPAAFAVEALKDCGLPLNFVRRMCEADGDLRERSVVVWAEYRDTSFRINNRHTADDHFG